MVERGRQDAVHDDTVDVVAEQRQIRVGAPSLGDDEPFGVHDEPRARDVAVGQQLTHTLEAVVETPDAAEHLVTGDGQAGEPAQHRPRELRQAPLRVEHAVHVPTEHVGQRQQPDRLGRGRAVDDHEVVVAARSRTA